MDADESNAATDVGLTSATGGTGLSVPAATATMTPMTGASKPVDKSPFDSDLFPQLLPGVMQLCTLLVQASRDINSLTLPDATDTANGSATRNGNTAGTPAHPKVLAQSSTTALPSFVLGATSDEELTNTWDALYVRGGDTASSEPSRRTELHLQIIEKAQALRNTLRSAEEAVRTMPGAQTTLSRQRQTIALLEAQLRRQDDVEANFVQASSIFTPPSASTAMDPA